MEPKTVGLLRNFESIKAHAREIHGSLNEFESTRIQAQATQMTPSYVIVEVEALERGKIKETEMLLDEYWRSSSDVNSILNMTLQYFSAPSTVNETKGTLRQIAIECDKVIGALSTLITPLSPEDADKLSKLRSEIAELTTKLDINYEKNLSIAINEYEKGHHLASALITGRVIIYILDQIEGGRPIDEKIKFLQDKNIIEKGTKGEEVKAFIMKAGKKARNIFSHNIDRFAEPSDALGMLGDSVKLLGIFAKLKKSSS